MPVFEHLTNLPHQPSVVFDFLLQPANLPRVMPPEFQFSLIEGPDRLSLGAKIIVLTRRWGYSQRITSEVTALEPDQLLEDIQRDGPFKKWEHRHILERTPEGTRMTDRIEFQPPGGLIGMLLKESTIVAELEEVFAYRDQQFQVLLGKKS
jgi:ligand-binding SRPBCC domain-containing protein